MTMVSPPAAGSASGGKVLGAPAGRAVPAGVVNPHLHPAQHVADQLAVDPAVGLSEGEAARRLAAHGSNQLDERARRPAWLRFTDQFRSSLIAILLGAALLAGLVGTFKDTVVITVVLLINATLGFVQENRAERSLDALREMLVPTARVRRGGTVRATDAAGLVPGDVVLLEAGDRLPADGRLLVAESVSVDESALTGESQPVSKSTDIVLALAGGPVPVADRAGMAHMNTSLTRGRAELVVTATGMDTQVGAIAGLLQQGVEPPTPLQRQMDAVGKRIALIGGIAVALYVVLALLRGQPPAELALSAVALAVATVPEGLPAVLALTLSLGVGRMARRGAIVKRLASVETLGSATVICSDKTGTLTLNQMTARALVLDSRRVRIEGEGYAPEGALFEDGTDIPAGGAQALLEPLVLCSDATLTGTGSTPGIAGDPTEGALVVAGAKAGLDVTAVRAARPRIGELPFDSARKFMATLHDEDGSTRVFVKGAPDVLLERCTHQLTEHGNRPLDLTARAAFAAEVTRLAASGLRVLAGATVLLPGRPAAAPTGSAVQSDAGPGREGPDERLAGQLTGLTMLGLVGIADPPRPQARDAIALAQRAGISVKMITGDHRDTALAIARELGINGDVVTGSDLDEMADGELQERIEAIGVFARVAPEHKVMVVRALVERGHIVAMTGDGVNDAAALRAAHIGVAMGTTGTEVTKQVSAMVLVDDDFATIVDAVEEGRAIYDNVVTFVRFQISTNIGAILTFLGATAVGLPAPLNAIQVLWVNIIMDGPPAMALGVDQARPHLMDEPPRHPDAQLLDRHRLLPMLRSGAVMAAGTLGVFAVARTQNTATTALTMAFTTFVLFQIFNALNARAGTQTVFTRRLFTNRWLWGSLVAIVALQIAAVTFGPMQSLFGTGTLRTGQWLACLAVAATGLVLEESLKLIRCWRART